MTDDAEIAASTRIRPEQRGQARTSTLGLRLGSTENKRLCIELLQDLQSRGLRINERILCVICGGKGLRWAIKDVLGDLAVVQRCT